MNLSPNKANKISIIAALVFAVLALAGRYGNIPVLLPVGLVGMAAAVIFKAIFYRCPYCRAYLGKGSHIDFCPRCGKRMY